MDKITQALDTNISALREVIETLVMVDVGLLATVFTFMLIFLMVKLCRR